MYCIYCGEELKHNEHIQDNLFECKNCDRTFEIYPKITPDEVDDDFGLFVEGSSYGVTEDGVVEDRLF